MRRIGLVALSLVLACLFPAAARPAGDDWQASDFEVRGRAVWRGKTLPLYSAFAKVEPAENKLDLYVYGFRVNEFDIKRIKQSGDFSRVRKRAEDPEKWPYNPFLWITLTLAPGKAFAPENIKENVLGFCSFLEKRYCITVSGSGFDMGPDFSGLTLSGTRVGDVVNFSLSSRRDRHEYDIEVNGRALITRVGGNN